MRRSADDARRSEIVIAPAGRDVVAAVAPQSEAVYSTIDSRLEPGELDAYFREIGPLVADCQFSDCSHEHEPGCAVRAAVADGRITPQRYDSYLRLRSEHDLLDRGAY